MQKVVRRKATDNLVEDIRQVVNEIGGIKKFIHARETVLVKGNFNTADPFPASSDIEFIKASLQIVNEANPKRMILGESSTISANTKEVLTKKGAFELEKEFQNLTVLPFSEDEWVRRNIPEGKFLNKVSVPRILGEVDKIILLPCLKTHFLAKFTGSLKLAVAFMQPTERISMHSRRLQEKIAELNLIYKPDLIIMDARKCFINHGPSSGEIGSPNLILASESRISIDIEGVKIIQEFPSNSLKNTPALEIPQIRHAKEIGIF